MTEYPSNASLLNPPDEFSFYYVASSYLDGFINYVDIVKSFVCCADKDYLRYANEQILISMESKFKDEFHAKFHDSANGFNYLLLCESVRHRWIFYYDQDCSDCFLIKRLKEDVSAEKLLSSATPPRSKIVEFPCEWLTGWKGF